MPVPADGTWHGPPEAVAEWLTANGIDPCDVPLHSFIVIECDPIEGRSISYTAVIRSDDGSILHDPHAGGPTVEGRSAPLKATPPASVQVNELMVPLGARDF